MPQFWVKECEKTIKWKEAFIQRPEHVWLWELVNRHSAWLFNVGDLTDSLTDQELLPTKTTKLIRETIREAEIMGLIVSKRRRNQRLFAVGPNRPEGR